jgi:4,5:9,10-diseco-3-hydroxy-5,9,17-trioxoandrosta-1(10),2-diene-4-oate hydrolase
MDRVVPEGEYADVGDGLRVHYHARGEGGVVLFLHGSGPGASGWSNFRHNLPAFAEAGYRAIAPDTLGFGYSSKPEGADYDLDFVVGGLERFLKAIGVASCAVVGNSHGGAMAIRLARRRPELVTKLVVMGAGGLEDRDTYMKLEGIRTMMKVVLSPEGITRDGMRRIFGLQLFDPKLLTEELLDERCSIAALQPKRVFTTLTVPNLVPELAELRCPVLALWGAEDKFCPVSGALTIARTCKRARATILSECGHWVMVEHAAFFNRACVDFLREAS